MPKGPEHPARPRLETQIHRRKKAKATSPLLPEWEYKDRNQGAPLHLRTDVTRMNRRSSQ